MTETERRYTRRAAEARARAAYKGGGRDARIAGHLALAYEALARAKENRLSEESDPQRGT